MNSTGIYENIAKRTGGEIYIGVVGPVRSGKSTFIRRFMESVVIPNIADPFEKNRARDEIPQSAGGRTIMTTEPKFIPDEAVSIRTGDASFKVKMVDCVGYLIPEVLGTDENGETRMVHTPWSAEPLPFEEAAETGTRKVITEHATIGMLVTSDGTVGDIPRDNYVGAEERIAAELNEIGKPFAVVLNSSHPETEEAMHLALSLEEKYGVPVALVNCMELNAEDIAHILEMVLLEFPLREVMIELPMWMTILEGSHPLREGLTKSLADAIVPVQKLGGVNESLLSHTEDTLRQTVSTYAEGGVEDIRLTTAQIDPGSGRITLRLTLPDALYYAILSTITDIPMKNETELLCALRSLSDMKKEHDKYAAAIREVEEKGYGIVMPECGELTLAEPELLKQSGGYGVRIRATAPSIHMIKTNIETEFSPIVGTEEQSRELIRYLTDEYAADPEGVWESNMFGKSLWSLVHDGLSTKLTHMPEDARGKFGETLSKIINDGASGLVCIIL